MFKREAPKTLDQGFSLVAALDPSIDFVSGAYLVNGDIAEYPPADDVVMIHDQDRLWALSEELVEERFRWYIGRGVSTWTSTYIIYKYLDSLLTIISTIFYFRLSTISTPLGNANTCVLSSYKHFAVTTAPLVASVKHNPELLLLTFPE